MEEGQRIPGARLTPMRRTRPLPRQPRRQVLGLERQPSSQQYFGSVTLDSVTLKLIGTVSHTLSG